MTTREGRFTRSAARDIRLRDPAIRCRGLHLGQVGEDSAEFEGEDAGRHHDRRDAQSQGKGEPVSGLAVACAGAFRK